jgi:hypothetical protein
MGAMKNYLCKVISETTDDIETADAVEYAIYSGWVKLTYDLQRDKVIIQKELLNIVEKFRRIAQENIQTNAPMLELIGQISDYK